MRYIPAVLVQCTLPHRGITGTEYTRRNGSISTHLLAPAKTGLPYGSIARLVIAWPSREAISLGERVIDMPASMAGLTRAIGIDRVSDARMRDRVRDQVRRLAASTITVLDARPEKWSCEKISIIDHLDFPGQGDGQVVIGDEFFARAVSDKPVPVDLNVLVELSRSPLAIDLYTWFGWRRSYQDSRPARIPWRDLVSAFSDCKRLDHFRGKLRVALKQIAKYYRVEEYKTGIMLFPGRTHIRLAEARRRKWPE